MVASSNGDVYPPFPHPIIVEDGPQSSEDGSGLHSPIFGAQFPQPHGDSIRYHHDQLDIHNAAGVLASQFDYKTLHLSVPQASPHVYDDHLDLHAASHTHHHSYSQDYPLSHRNHLGLDIPPHSYHTPRLPPPPITSGAGGLTYHLPAPHRRYSGDVSRDHSYSTGGTSSVSVPSVNDQRSFVPKREPDLQPTIQSAPSQQPQQLPQQLPQQSQQSTQPAQQQTASTSQNTTRRETSNLVIACRQCRARKIRCDSTRPICHNCVRRSNECQYDAVPKRRGPDKRPGTRQRSCKKRAADGSAPPIPPSKRKKAVAPSSETQNTPQPQRSPTEQPIQTAEQDDHAHLGQSSLSHHSELSSSAQSRALPDSYPAQSDKLRVSFTSAVQYDPKESWNSLLDGYSKTREQSMEDIVKDLSAVFTTRGHWLPFINVNEFARRLYGSDDRSLSQLSLVFAGLAVATLMKSSEMGLGTAGRNRAAWLRDKAQASLEASWSSQLIDIDLAKAALMLAVYESSAHHLYTAERERKALVHLDHIIRTLGLAFMDSNEPEVSTFTPNIVPIARRRTFGSTPKDNVRSSPIAHKCSCISFPSNSPVMPDQYSSFWIFTPPCDSHWNSEEADKEDCRRLCWSALSLVAGYTSRCLAFRKEPSELFMTDPANVSVSITSISSTHHLRSFFHCTLQIRKLGVNVVADICGLISQFRLLFPGEVLERGSPEHKAQSPKDSIWALYCRSMLLWNFCTIHLRKNSFTGEESSDLALQAWRETQDIQDALDLHTCNLDVALLYMCREYVYRCVTLKTFSLCFHILLTNPLQYPNDHCFYSPKYPWP
ncbi:hypothetical protein V8B97DRAFT_1936553 [Scleroderma yunnanense]